MATTRRIKHGLITFVETDFNCPDCTCPHTESDWYPKYEKSLKGHIYINCKGCKRKIGITTDMMGDVVVWMKSDETKQHNILKKEDTK